MSKACNEFLPFLGVGHYLYTNFTMIIYPFEVMVGVSALIGSFGSKQLVLDMLFDKLLKLFCGFLALAILHSNTTRRSQPMSAERMFTEYRGDQVCMLLCSGSPCHGVVLK